MITAFLLLMYTHLVMPQQPPEKVGNIQEDGWIIDDVQR